MVDRKPHTVEKWVTVSVTSLPAGWRNVYLYRHDDALRITQCPAILTQELRATETWQNMIHAEGAPTSLSHDDYHEPPYNTRVVFADYDSGIIVPAEGDDDYLGAVGPDEDPGTYH